MKKIMIALCAIVVTAVTQAASCNWNSYAVDSTMANPLVGGSYWLVSLGTSDAGLADLIVRNDGSVDFGSYTTVASGKITGNSN